MRFEKDTETSDHQAIPLSKEISSNDNKWLIRNTMEETFQAVSGSTL